MTLSSLLSLLPVALATPAEQLSFEVFSAPIELRYGQVYNRLQSPMHLPKEVIDRYATDDRVMAISGFDVEMVRLAADGSETPVKLNDHYLHHYALTLGSASTTDAMLSRAARDPVFARALSGCHAMTRAGVHSFVSELQTRRNDPDLVTFGSASGAEFRHNPQRFAAPYRQVLKRPEIWLPLLHIINTNTRMDGPSDADTPYSPLLECPCTPQRKFNVSAGTIDGKAADPPIQCSAEFAATDNPSCHLATYVGGWRCCEHHMFLVDTDKECSDPECSEKPVDDVRMKFTFFYEDAKPDVRQVEPAACCDVTSVVQGDENIEYDIPVCSEGVPGCVDGLHVVETVQPLAYFDEHPKSPRDSHSGEDLVDLVFAAPHLHVGGIYLELVDAVTNKTLCSVHAGADNTGGIAYGRGSSPGDEKGYLVGLDTCIWDGSTAPRFRRSHPMRTKAVYNASRGHTGVMSLWLMDVAAVAAPDFLV
eukprot:gb/GFBE01007702.1/.p1 GENE.gb/GFBE01007702.1/~~gb/GFBE01007702.1/.p1  ORF type:complete len:478 (+),score=94.30 gb/GFBE01007702.1/:1-1434(+)